MTFEPTDEQTQAIEAPERPVRVIAGAAAVAMPDGAMQSNAMPRQATPRRIS